MSDLDNNNGMIFFDDIDTLNRAISTLGDAEDLYWYELPDGSYCMEFHSPNELDDAVGRLEEAGLELNASKDDENVNEDDEELFDFDKDYDRVMKLWDTMKER